MWCVGFVCGKKTAFFVQDFSHLLPKSTGCHYLFVKLLAYLYDTGAESSNRHISCFHSEFATTLSFVQPREGFQDASYCQCCIYCHNCHNWLRAIHHSRST